MKDPLLELANACGVIPEFVDALGERRIASRDVLKSVLDALGVECGSARVIRSELKRIGRRDAGERITTRRTPCHRVRGKRRGVYANLYSVRATDDRGFGDFAALAELIDRAAGAGWDYVAINPLHALRPRNEDASPYSPVSRMWKNPLYLDLGRLVEDCFAGEDPRVASARRVMTALAQSRRLDYESIAASMAPLLAACHDSFVRKHLEPGTRRARAFHSFVARHGDSLERFARYRAIDAIESSRGRIGFSRWSAELRDPESAAVARFSRAHDSEIRFERWLQFELSQQWLTLSRRARDAGLRVGLYTDLAIGAAPDSADVWGDPSGHVRGFSLGAPPDGYSRTGQVWNLPPMNPRGLVANGGERFRKLLRATMDGAGAMRIDHAIGLVRQYWVPNGAEGTDGVMVAMPARALFSAIAKESRAAECVVVAEDLGTLPESLPGLLREYGLLSTRVAMFCRDATGGFEPPRRYPRRAAASVNTHDLPPFFGWWEGAELPIRRRLGLIDRKGERLAREARRHERQAIARMLRAEGFLAPKARGARATLDALHAALVASSCSFATLSLDDLAGELDPINVPTATSDRYPVWSRRMGRALSQIVLTERGRRIGQR